jgi:hypothetical protein
MHIQPHLGVKRRIEILTPREATTLLLLACTPSPTLGGPLEHHFNAAEANLELERARLAEKKEIRPPGATAAEFDRQRQRRSTCARE